jgi:hypothetical protein
MKNENGVVLVVALMMLVVLSLLGVMATRTSSVEIMVARNHYYATKAFFNAESGIGAAFATMNDPDSSCPKLSFDCWDGYEFNSEGFGTPEMVFDVTINHSGKTKTGFIGGDPIEIPIELIRSEGTGPTNAKAMVEVEAIRDMVLVDIPAPLYIKYNLTSNGVPQSAEGEWAYFNGQEDCEPVRDIITAEPTDPDRQASDWSGGLGALGGDVVDEVSEDSQYPIQETIDALKDRATKIEEQNGLELWGGGIYMLTDADGDGIVRVQDFVGKGVLLVDNNFIFGGTIEWHGLILVSGNVEFNGGGSKEIYGAFLGNGHGVANGRPQFLYDCEALGQVIDHLEGYRMLSWRQP